MIGRIDFGFAVPCSPRRNEVWADLRGATDPLDPDTITLRVWTGRMWVLVDAADGEGRQALYAARQRLRRIAVDRWLRERFQ